MFDNLRDQAASSPYFQQEDELIEERQLPGMPPPRRTLDQITGMTAQQRFMVAAMLLMVVCLLGTISLIVLGKMALPFF